MKRIFRFAGLLVLGCAQLSSAQSDPDFLYRIGAGAYMPTGIPGSSGFVAISAELQRWQQDARHLQWSSKLGNFTFRHLLASRDLIFSLYGDNTISMVDVDTGAVTGVWPFTRPIYLLDVSSDNRYLAVVHPEIMVANLYDISGRRWLHASDQGNWRSLKLSGDGSRLVLTQPGLTLVYRTSGWTKSLIDERGAKLATLSPDGQTVYSASDWDMRWQSADGLGDIFAYRNVARIERIVVSDEGDKLAISDEANNIAVFNTHTKQLLHQWRARSYSDYGPINRLSFVNQGSEIFVGQENAAQPMRWNTLNGEYLGLAGRDFVDRPKLKLSKDSSLFFVPSEAQINASISISRTQDGSIVSTIKTQFGSRQHARDFSPDGALVLGRRDGRVTLWSVKTGQVERSDPQNSEGPVGFDETGNAYITLGQGNYYKRATVDGSVLKIFPRTESSFCDVSPDGKYLVETFLTGTKVYDLQDFSLRASSSFGGRRLVFSAAKHALLISGEDQFMVCDFPSLTNLRSLPLVNGQYQVTSDGERIYSRSVSNQDFDAAVYDWDSGEALNIFTGALSVARDWEFTGDSSMTLFVDGAGSLGAFRAEIPAAPKRNVRLVGVPMGRRLSGDDRSLWSLDGNVATFELSPDPQNRLEQVFESNVDPSLLNRLAVVAVTQVNSKVAFPYADVQYWNWSNSAWEYGVRTLLGVNEFKTSYSLNNGKADQYVRTTDGLVKFRLLWKRAVDREPTRFSTDGRLLTMDQVSLLELK